MKKTGEHKDKIHVISHIKGNKWSVLKSFNQRASLVRKDKGEAIKAAFGMQAKTGLDIVVHKNTGDVDFFLRA